MNKKIVIICFVILILTLFCMGINRFIIQFPDTIIRLNGIVMLIDIFLFVYSSIKYKNSIDSNK